jgi:hypothetical protein
VPGGIEASVVLEILRSGHEGGPFNFVHCGAEVGAMRWQTQDSCG